MNKIVYFSALALSVMSFTANAFTKPVTIVEQGSFATKGTVKVAEGTYNPNDPKDLSGQTLHGDHAYVMYQIPKNPRQLSLVFLHGYGQSGKTWETTPDGRDGFNNIFLEEGYKTYVMDEPGRGRAGRSREPRNVTQTPDDELWFNTFRIGVWPDFYDNVAFAKDEKSLDQFFRQMTPDTGIYDENVFAKSVVDTFEVAGDGILMTHSAGGGPGFRAATDSDKIKAVISLEPGTFPFPEGELPDVEETTSMFPAKGYEVSMEDFKKLIAKPIVVYFGDNIPKGKTPVKNYGKDNWRTRLNLAHEFERVAKKYHGKVSIVSLPDLGVKGNTHFMMSDLNNRDVAKVIENWLHENGLDKR